MIDRILFLHDNYPLLWQYAHQGFLWRSLLTRSIFRWHNPYTPKWIIFGTSFNQNRFTRNYLNLICLTTWLIQNDDLRIWLEYQHLSLCNPVERRNIQVRILISGETNGKIEARLWCKQYKIKTTKGEKVRELGWWKNGGIFKKKTLSWFSAGEAS